MSTVLIVGCGYLGTRVAALLLRRGDRVLATTRQAGAHRRVPPARHRPVLFDVLKPTPLPKADGDRPRRRLDRSQGVPQEAVYVDGLRSALRHYGSPRLVHVSSTSVYGQTGGEWVDEDAPTEPPAWGVRVVPNARLPCPAPAVVLRFAGIYGPGG